MTTFEDLIVGLAIICEERNALIDEMQKLSDKEDSILRRMRLKEDPKSPHPSFEINVIQMARTLDPN